MSDERDYAEEAYWRHFCAECDGRCQSTDGHADLLAADHAEALEEDEAHDAAMSMAITLPAELLPLIGGRARQLPQSLRTRIAHARHMVQVPRPVTW